MKKKAKLNKRVYSREGVGKIKEMRDKGVSCVKIGEMFGVSNVTIIKYSKMQSGGVENA